MTVPGSRTGAGDTGRVTVCYPFAGDSLGGSHHSLLGLLRSLNQQKFRPLIVLEKEAARLSEHFAGFEVVTDPASPRRSFEAGRPFGISEFGRTLPGLWRRSRFLRGQGVSIVHTNDGRTHAAWALAAKLGGCKLVWHHRGDPTARGLRFVAPHVADRILSVSRFALPRSRAARKARVVYSPFQTDMPVDRAGMRQCLLDELALPDDALICGYFGNFIARKRPLAFIEAIARLRQIVDRPVAGLMFGEPAHSGLEAEMRDRMVSSELAGAVRPMGYRSPGWAWISGCDVLLVPAIDEPLGRTLVEAMLVGTPVVATRSGGNPEAIPDGLGVLVAPDDPGALAEGCAAIAADPEGTASMVARARAASRERFAEERHVTAVTAVYEELVREWLP